MKTKITPEYVLTMLQELKKVMDDRRFSPSQFSKKFPTYNVFRIFLFSKGLIKKEFGINNWISIEPNIIMARELLKLYYEYVQETKEKYLKNKEINKKNEVDKKIEVLENLQEKIDSNKSFARNIKRNSKTKSKNNFMDFAKEIRKEGESWNDAIARASKIMKGGKSEGIKVRPLTMEEMFPMSYELDRIAKDTDSKYIIKKLEDKIENQEKEYNELKKEFNELVDDYNVLGEQSKQIIDTFKFKNEQLNKQINRNKNLISTLQEKNEKKNDEIEYLKNKLKGYEARELMSMSKPSPPEPSLPEPIFDRYLTSQEIMGSKTLTSKSTRTFKVLGISIFTIDNK